MSAWKDDDEVTTTYGSIQLSLEQAHAAGVKAERERIIELIERLPFIWGGNTQMIQTSRDEVIALIKGETDE
jgi:hypothetical protein